MKVRTSSPRRTKWVAIAVVIALAGAFPAAMGGCILAEPSADLPETPSLPPRILHGSVVPSTSSVLGVFPDKLIVPVELSDPTQSFQWAVFMDYNAVTGTRVVVPPRTSPFEPGTTEGRVRDVQIALTPPPDVDQCHVLQVVVALRLTSSLEPRSAHTPQEPGGDIATWFYSPGGDFRGCPPLDAGIDASILPPDAEAGAP